MYVRLPPDTPRRSLVSHLAWFTAVVAVVAVAGLLLAAASPADTEDAAHGRLVAADGPVSDVDIAGFEQAIDAATSEATDEIREAEAAYLAAINEFERVSAEQEAARVAAEQEAARVAAEAEALRVTVRHTGSGRSSQDQWAALRNCESSGNYAAVSSTGAYRGAYQFSQQTWNSVASAHHPWLVGVDPATASPADQDAQARALYAMSGRGQWPHCGRYLS